MEESYFDEKMKDPEYRALYEREVKLLQETEDILQAYEDLLPEQQRDIWEYFRCGALRRALRPPG